MIMITTQVCAHRLRCNRLLTDVMNLRHGYLCQHRSENDPRIRQHGYVSQHRSENDPLPPSPADARMPVFAVDLVRAAALRDPLSAARIEEDR